MEIGLKLSFELGSLSTSYFESIVNKYLLFEPYGFGFKYKDWAWNEKKFWKGLKSYTGDVWSSIYDRNGNIIHIGPTGTRNPHLSISIKIEKTKFLPSNPEIEALINQPGFVAAYLFNETYTYVQSESYEGNFKGRKDLSPEILETIKHTPYRMHMHGGREYDTRYNPGRQILIGHTWLLPAYKMWFGAPFFNIVPKERIASFSHAVEIKEVLPDILYVQLFENIEESHSKDSMFRQAKWSEWLNFDDLEKKYP